MFTQLIGQLEKEKANAEWKTKKEMKVASSENLK